MGDGRQYKTPLISSAIEMAARNLDLPEGAIFHSDRGSNYTSAEFGEKLGELSIKHSSDGPEYATITPCRNR